MQLQHRLWTLEIARAWVEKLQESDPELRCEVEKADVDGDYGFVKVYDANNSFLGYV